MNRMKTFDVPHKGLRNALSQLSLAAGRTDYTNLSEVTTLYLLGRKVFGLLSVHAHDENEVTLRSLEDRKPGASQHDKKDHEEIEGLQIRLEEQLQQIQESAMAGKDMSEPGSLLYRKLNDFYAQYLAHMAEEEEVTQQLLWQFFSDEELANHRKEIMAGNPPETLLTWFHFVLPAQNHAERVGLLQGFKRNAPAPFFEKSMEVIAAVLDKEDFRRLKEAL